MRELYFPARVLDKQWADRFVRGEIFMRSLTEFGAWNALERHADPTLNNSFRGDLREGAIKNIADPEKDDFFRLFPNDLKQVLAGGARLDAEDIQYFNILCLCCVDYVQSLHRFVPPSEKMKEFGDTAVIIKDTNQFLHRLWNGARKSLPDFCLLMDKVEYYDPGVTTTLNPLFHKTASYRAQNELRIAIGRLDKCRPTDNGKHELIRSTQPLMLEIGDLSDITQILTIEEFCHLEGLETPVLPMIDCKSTLLNEIIADTKVQMSQYRPRQQKIIFSI